MLYPEVGFTKAQVIDYYTRIAPAMLPHTQDHPLTLKRYPNGVDGEFFYEKNCPKHRPPWVQTATVWSGGNNRDMHYCLCQDLPTLVWLAQIRDARNSHVTVARLEPSRAADAGLRPRPRAAGDDRRVLSVGRVLGSVANSVAHNAPCDVYIAKTDAD